MRSSKDFNIITGETLQYQPPRSTSLINLPTKTKLHPHLPPLGVPKDHKSFQYSYFQPNEEQIQTFNVSRANNKGMLNFSFEKRDPITHRKMIPTVSQFNHKDFCSKMDEANMKGILTYHIDKNRLYAPNFHENFPERVKNKEFHKHNRICSMISNVEKTSAGRYFRKMK